MRRLALCCAAALLACDDGADADPAMDVGRVADAGRVDAGGDAPDGLPSDAGDEGPADAAAEEVTNLHLSDRVLAIAHRGGKRAAPEQTLAAFTHAAELGVDVLEMDLQMTSDGIVVCLHDSTVDRTTDGVGRLKSMTFAEVRALDAGYRFTRDGGETYPFRGTGVQIPTFREVLETFPTFHYAIEIKQSDPPIIDEVVAVLRETGADARVSVAAFADPVVLAFREAAPDMVTALALGEIIGFTRLDDDTEADYAPPGRLLQIPPRQGGLEILTPDLVARAHRLGMKVQVWTVNDREEMRTVLDLGVDGVMTDDPEALLDVMGRR